MRGGPLIRGQRIATVAIRGGTEMTPPMALLLKSSARCAWGYTTRFTAEILYSDEDWIRALHRYAARMRDVGRYAFVLMTRA